METQFTLGGVPIGGNAPPLVLPDIGTFFNNDLALAENLLREVLAAGVKVVKGEILHTAAIALDDGTLERYYDPAAGMVAEHYRALIERKVVSLEQYERLFRVCHAARVPFVLSVYDAEGADFAKRIGACALKIASTNVVHAPLIRHVASLGLPVLIDTGKSTLEEIARAVQWARDAGARQLVVEHSPEAPPSPLENHHLRMLQTFARLFGAPVGLSDHHAGEEMLYAATALGASILEKGVCPTGMSADQDVHHALPANRLADVIVKCDNIHRALGSAMRHLPGDRVRPAARMGLVARQDLAAGTVVSARSVDFAFPAKGIPVEEWDLVQGWRLAVDLPRGAIIEWHHVHPDPAENPGT